MSELTHIDLSPILPGWACVLVLLLGAALLAYGAWRQARGTSWRAAAFLILFGLLLDPSLVREEREALSDIALIVTDRSTSQSVGDRPALMQQTEAALRQALARQRGLEVRHVAVAPADAGGPADRSAVLTALETALADIPKERLAGSFLLTDGQVHDVPANPAEALAGRGPIHTLLIGRKDERDRRIVIVKAPAYGIVDRSVQMVVRVEDPGAPADPVRLTLRLDADQTTEVDAIVGQDLTLTVPIRHGGPTMVEAEVPVVEGELTAVNNKAAVVISGVRDRLRVLLVSGEAHNGERTWRNLLKADPAVDLAHFTILRSPEQQDGTPTRELSLIAFPIRELFEVKLNEFDLVVFDRFSEEGGLARQILPPDYYENLANFVLKGGGLLEVSGADFIGRGSLARTALGEILPTIPTDTPELRRPFKPQVSALGERHPVTQGLPGAPLPGSAAAPQWGRWFRMSPVALLTDAIRRQEGLPPAPTGPKGEPQPPPSVVMTGPEGGPLLTLARAGQGRVAQLASDNIWLWSRGFEGGGPQAELLRRLAHWLMREPSLEEEALTARVERGQLIVERRSLTPGPRTVQLTRPDGGTEQLALAETQPGHTRANRPADLPGVWTVREGDLRAFAVVGEATAPELADMRASEAKLRPVAAASGGGIWWADEGLPTPRRVRPASRTAGPDWAGLVENEASLLRGASRLPLLPTWPALIAAFGLLLLAWRQEGR